jgi:hypothetical protein
MFLRLFFLAFLLALDIDAGKSAWRATADSDSSFVIRHSSFATRTLPNSCELLAAQASAEMRRAGVWTRILIVRYSDRDQGHAFCVFQPSFQIVAYDDTGSYELATASHDPQLIARTIGARLHRPIISGRFLE